MFIEEATPMKQYLNDFFERFSYDPNDAAFLTQAYNSIISNAEASILWQKALALYEKNQNCDYEELLHLTDEAAKKAGIHLYTAELLIFICLSKHTKKLYAERGLSESLFDASMLDLRYKLRECKAVKGIIGSFVADWFTGFFNLTRFAFGRLQFEIIPFRHTYEKNGHVLSPESLVINVHIPGSGEPLDKASCDAAFAQAYSFFRKELKEDVAFVCHSWLLYPENKYILSEKSNISRFMSRFDIISSGVLKHADDLWRIFDTDEKNLTRLPSDTSLRRAYIEHIKKGGMTGYGFGVFFYP